MPVVKKTAKLTGKLTGWLLLVLTMLILAGFITTIVAADSFLRVILLALVLIWLFFAWKSV